MKVSIFGLGYVGAVSAACLAKEGHEVVGVDPNRTKVRLIQQGVSPIIEEGVGDMIADAIAKGTLTATESVQDAIAISDLSLICVGTPSQINGSLDLRYVRHVCEQIGEALRDQDRFHVVVARSTMLPGSMRNVVIPVLEECSGKRAGVDFGVCNNPEFLREGSAVWDFYNPPKTVIGETDDRSGEILASLYAGLDAPLIRTEVETAEMVKYTDNVWHALKVGFANEIGSICKASGLDGRQVMDIFCQDTKLNLSPYYMKPGFAFGGSCLPKDVRALTYKARECDVAVPILDAIMPSNELQVRRALDMVIAAGHKKISILGFAFKAGTDDLRESPVVELIERLLGKGFDLKVYDRNVNIASLVGANRDYILNHIPHISKLMVDSIEEALAHAETVVIGNPSKEFKGMLERLSPQQIMVDLWGVTDRKSSASQYRGICW
ncbi:UDP-glucose/GDP-mannose dehydrogenase family protein [uncultured Thiocystis sp.]|jgi:GDP-mannose 6-dehydrogenase|uniref:nucleotide sugar dehydrogenase n=1 Tax=uncultured Thiocystis sp. TaxID=1202134 RepID=UPI0025E5EF23|nr:UDP-glucose/GDP-mannose dehydrogenase family protein [uncultured Thiocystis sp.]